MSGATCPICASRDPKVLQGACAFNADVPGAGLPHAFHAAPQDTKPPATWESEVDTARLEFERVSDFYKFDSADYARLNTLIAAERQDAAERAVANLHILRCYCNPARAGWGDGDDPSCLLARAEAVKETK